MAYDFHTHSFLSDGELSPVELIRRAAVKGYQAIAVTDHVGPGNMQRVIQELIEECRVANGYWKIRAIPGVELTHVPAGSIDDWAKQAREFGAEIVVVHGETLVEPVEPGTNLAAVSSSWVDVLAHPGLLGTKEVELAVKNGVFLEITARGGHNVANGYVMKTGKSLNADFLVNSDTHVPENLLSDDWARIVALGAGFEPDEVEKILVNNPLKLLRKIESRNRNPKS